MKFASLLVAATLTAALPAPARAQAVLTGDTRLACEAILCLAAAVRPAACAASIARYFSISFRKFSDTLRGRINFLNLCPVSRQTPEMAALIQAMAHGAGRCDTAALNATLLTQVSGLEGPVMAIDNRLPDYCAAYTGHSYTNFAGMLPRYVGTPERGGYWVDAKDYDRELLAYNDRIAREDAERARNGGVDPRPTGSD